MSKQFKKEHSLKYDHSNQMLFYFKEVEQMDTTTNMQPIKETERCIKPVPFEMTGYDWSERIDLFEREGLQTMGLALQSNNVVPKHWEELDLNRF